MVSEIVFSLGFAFLLVCFFIYKFICYKFHLLQLEAEKLINPYAFTTSCGQFERKIEELKKMLVLKFTTVEDVGEDLFVFDIIRIAHEIIIEALKKRRLVFENEISMAQAAMDSLRNQQNQEIPENQALSRSEFIRQMKHVKNEISPLLTIVRQALQSEVNQNSSSVIAEPMEDVDSLLYLIFKTLEGVQTRLTDIIRMTEEEGLEEHQMQQPAYWESDERRGVINQLLNSLNNIM